MSFADILLILGGGCLVAAGYLAFGPAAGLSLLGAGLIFLSVSLSGDDS